MSATESVRCSWGDGPLAAFDLETTGTDVDRDRIVSATVVTFEPGRDQQPRVAKWLVNPGIPIAPGATAAHGMTDADVIDAQDPAEAVGEIGAALRAWWDRALPVVIFNARFDLSLMRAETLRRQACDFVPGLVIDPFVIDKAVDRYRRGKRQLDPTATHYQVPLVGPAHDDTVDALGAMRLAWRLARLYPGIGTFPLDRLQVEQAKAYAAQQQSLESYQCDLLAREGRWDEAMALHLPREWPLSVLPDDWAREHTPAANAAAEV